MDLPFSLRGLDGIVHATLERNDRPELVGSGPDSAGFPWCHASVDYPARGYDAVLGWVQLVRSDDNVSGGRDFEIDPLAFLGDLPHPFCWLGLQPQLFDAPSRNPLQDMDWLAHSFLCVPDGGDDAGVEVHALTGFSWGFRIRGETIDLVPPAALGPEDWDLHAATLSSTYPVWRIVPGFRTG
ncbi:MAG TPA: hypothetical protein VFL59_15225 [Candidatus Nanopelagicales bacterium]|nr:hypothetical protein [Candidatus Nanopelagicales bacterium]